MNTKLSIKLTLVIGLAIIASLNVLLYLIFGPAPMYDLQTLCIIFTYCVLFSVLIWKSNDDILPFSGLITYFFVVFIFTRILSFLCLKDFVELMLGFELPARDINNGLIYIGLGTISLFLGHYSCSLLFKKLHLLKRKPTSFIQGVSSGGALAMFIIVCLVQMYITVYLGNSVLGDIYYGAKHKVIGVLAVLFHVDTAFLVALVGMFALYAKHKTIRNPFILLLILYMFILVIFGSRQGGIAILEHVLICMLILLGNFKENLKTYAFFFVSMVIISLISFPLGTAIRSAMLDSLDQHEIQGGLYKSKKSVVPLETFNTGSWIDHIKFNPSAMLNRMNIVDTVALTMHLKPNEELRNDYLNVLYGLKSAINSIVPGVIFKDATVNTAMLWPFVYEARDIKYLYQKNYYESFYWTAWGIAYILFGYSAGLFALFLAGVIFQSMYFLIFRYFSKWAYYYAAWLLYNIFMFYGIMGVDHWLVILEKSFVTISIALGIKILISKVGMIIKKLKLKTKEVKNTVKVIE